MHDVPVNDCDVAVSGFDYGCGYELVVTWIADETDMTAGPWAGILLNLSSSCVVNSCPPGNDDVNSSSSGNVESGNAVNLLSSGNVEDSSPPDSMQTSHPWPA